MASKKRLRHRGEEPSADRKQASGSLHSRTMVVLALLLVLSTAAAYWGILGNGFTNYDDYDYVTRNPHVQHGITAKSIAWAFNIGYASNWHPLTWLSHMFDCQLYGLKPWGHHLTSLLLHIANVLLVFWVLGRMTGAPWRSAFVAALFGLHPLHVESVAWASERKDVLCTLFCLLAILAYVRYCERQTLRRYAVVALAFALALLAKPMALTLPFLLLILDFWPLKRFGQPVSRLLLEKAPLIALSAASGVVTVLAQHTGGSISGLELIPLASRIMNATFAYVEYIILTLRPIGMAAHYPYLKIFPAWEVAGAVLFLGGVSVVAARFRGRYPYLLAGWVWFVVTLLPVIGLVQVGSQSFADRYTYVPLIGIFIAITWGACDLAGLRRWKRLLHPAHALAAAAVVICLVLAVLTAGQTRVWKDSFTLWRHTLAIAPNEWMAHYNLGSLLEESGRQQEAIPYYLAATKIAPDLRDAQYNLANLLEHRGDITGALTHYNEVVRIDPTDSQAHNNLCCILGRMRVFGESIQHGRMAVKYKPDYAEAHGNLAISLALNRQYAEALDEARLCERYGGRLPKGFAEALTRAMARRKP